MSLIRYQTHAPAPSASTPLTRLSAFQNEVDRLFDLPALLGGNQAHGGFSPALDLYQDKNNITVRAELPGLKKEDIALSLRDGLLTLSGERKHEKTSAGETSLRSERFFGRFERTVTLPMQVDGSRVTASYEDGILTVTLPKSEAAKPRQIEIAVR